MKKIKIIAKSEKGEKAIKQHLQEIESKEKLKKLMKKYNIRQYMTEEYPLTLILAIENLGFENLIKKGLFREDTFLVIIKDQIINALKANGAEENKDYEVIYFE